MDYGKLTDQIANIELKTRVKTTHIYNNTGLIIMQPLGRHPIVKMYTELSHHLGCQWENKKGTRKLDKMEMIKIKQKFNNNSIQTSFKIL